MNTTALSSMPLMVVLLMLGLACTPQTGEHQAKGPAIQKVCLTFEDQDWEGWPGYYEANTQIRTLTTEHGALGFVDGVWPVHKVNQGQSILLDLTTTQGTPMVIKNITFTLDSGAWPLAIDPQREQSLASNQRLITLAPEALPGTQLSYQLFFENPEGQTSFFKGEIELLVDQVPSTL